MDAKPSHISTLHWRTFWAAQGLTWVGYGLLFAITLRLYIPWPDVVLAHACMAAVTGCVCTAGLHWFYARIRWTDRRPRWLAPIVVLASLVVGGVWYILSTVGGELLDPFATHYTHYMDLDEEIPFIDHPAMFPLVVLLWSLGYLGTRQWVARRRQREQILKADALAHEARLQMLRYQLNPHFLFNALNSIGALAAEDPARVQTMVSELSAFLRYSLLDPTSFVVPLADELRAVQHYLAIEQIRFEEDLEVSYAVDAAAAERTVPAFILLPLVENAVKHGQVTSPTPLRVRIYATVKGDVLSIEVANTGDWIDSEARAQSKSTSTGTGLRNLRQRLAEQYPARHRFEHSEQNGWVVACIEIHQD